jgi:NAD(P)-dependent dehydrogenase (short-subunit alcohol dehydrogenase family)
MTGEICVVTGATSGIGKATAAALAGRGAQVILVARDRGRGEAVAAEVAAPGGPAPQLEVADLASMGQVRALADRLGALERIDVLVNNAGLMASQRRVTADGYDEVFAVNHLAPFLLTNLLLGKLAAAAPARVITVTSDAHTAARLDLDDLQLEYGWQSWRAYANSKLANVLFTRELARRLEGSAVSANCAHPGLVRTRFGREARLPMRAAVMLARPFMLSPRRGAATIVYLATSSRVAGATGGYYVKSQQREPSPAARDDATAHWLWQLSEELTGLTPARPTGI